MIDDANAGQAARRWGLCATCTHAIVITSDRGSQFLQCGLAKTDPRFRRYPPTPVGACVGYEPKARE
jgi:hypothetical protein